MAGRSDSELGERESADFAGEAMAFGTGGGRVVAPSAEALRGRLSEGLAAAVES